MSRPADVARAAKLAKEARALNDLNNELARHLDAGRNVPCVGRLEWITEDADEAEYAASHCYPCDAFDACHAAAEVLQPTAGVWAATWASRRRHTKQDPCSKQPERTKNDHR